MERDVVVITACVCVCLLTGGCEYGDKVPWCSGYVRGPTECQRSEIADYCCHTCAPYLSNQPATTSTSHNFSFRYMRPKAFVRTRPRPITTIPTYLQQRHSDGYSMGTASCPPKRLWGLRLISAPGICPVTQWRLPPDCCALLSSKPATELHNEDNK